MDWLTAYVVTLAIEIPLVLLLMRAAGWFDGGFSLMGALTLAWLVNLTHPVLWWAGPSGWGQVLVGEAVVVLVEGLLLGLVAARVTRSPAPWITVLMGVLTALAANALSFALGLGLDQWVSSAAASA